MSITPSLPGVMPEITGKPTRITGYLPGARVRFRPSLFTGSLPGADA
jgi:hypothetical protein